VIATFATLGTHSSTNLPNGTSPSIYYRPWSSQRPILGVVEINDWKVMGEYPKLCQFSENAGIRAGE
jgi:hypothetical protein